MSTLEGGPVSMIVQDKIRVLLALYAPQLTIPGFDSGFEDVFDDLLNNETKTVDRIFEYGSHAAIDDRQLLCGDVIALRHPTFGNYKPEDLGRWYFNAHDTAYIRSPWEVFEGLVWLLSDDADWLPAKYRTTFIEGIRSRDDWTRYGKQFDNSFQLALGLKKRSQFKLTRTLKASLTKIVEESIHNLGIIDNPAKIVEKFIGLNFISAYYDFQDWLREMRWEKT